MEKRWKQIIETWNKQHQWLYGLVGLMSGFLIGIVSKDVLSHWIVWFAENFWNDALGIAITVIVIDRIYERRNHQHQIYELKERLLSNLHSQIPQVVITGLEELKRTKLLYEDGLIAQELSNVNFSQQNMQKAQLTECHINHCNFVETDLSYANFNNIYDYQSNFTSAKLREIKAREAHFAGSVFYNVSFEEADFTEVYLSGVRADNTAFRSCNFEKSRLIEGWYKESYFRWSNMRFTRIIADFEECDFNFNDMFRAEIGGNFKNTSFKDSNLEGANFKYARFQDNVVLPDGMLYTSETDLEVFTNPKHPNFWCVWRIAKNYQLGARNFDQTLDNIVLSGKNLRGAYFRFSSIRNSVLVGTDLRGADLAGSELEKSNFNNANLAFCDLMNASMEGADLRGANLEGAELERCKFDKTTRFSPETILPDGTQWTKNAVLARFTDINHPEYEFTLKKINQLRAEVGLEPL